MDKCRADSLVLMPTYNEADNIVAMVEQLIALNTELDICILDDSSPDGTGVIADKLAIKEKNKSASECNIYVIHRPKKSGLASAYLEGFRFGLAHGYRYIVQMDADQSHSPQDVPRLLTAAKSGADLVLGSRWVVGGGTVNWSLVRKLVSQLGSFYARRVLSENIYDFTGGFKCWRSNLLAKIDLSSIKTRGYAFQIEMTMLALEQGASVIETPITFFERRAGQSKFGIEIIIEAVLAIPKMRARVIRRRVRKIFLKGRCQ